MFTVAALSDDLDVAAPAWAARENTCAGEGETPVGDVSIDDNLVLALPEGDGGLAAAAGVFNGLKGIRLKDVTKIAYSERGEGGVDGYNAPWFRIYTDDFANGIIFSPSTQPGGPGPRTAGAGTSSRRARSATTTTPGSSPTSRGPSSSRSTATS